MPSLESVNLMIWVAVGSRFENQSKAGISHFLEHMVFKGSKKRPTAKDISLAVDEIGGEINAATTKEWTRFYIKARQKHLERAFDVLSDMVLNPILAQEEIDREKGVIVQEIGMYEDTPISKIWDDFENLILKGSSLGRDVIGKRETVLNLKSKDFESYRDRHYFSDNMLITVSGGFDTKKAKELTQNYFGQVKMAKRIKDKKYSLNQRSPRVELKTKKIEQCHFILGFPGRQLGDKTRYAEAVLSAVLGGGMSSRLFTEVRERRGLAYSVRTESEHFVDTGYLAIYAGVHPKKTKEAIKVILDECYKVTKEVSISDKELAKAKEFIKGHLALSLESTSAVNSFFGNDELLIGKLRTSEEVFKAIDKVTKEEVVRLAKEIFKPNLLNLALIGPYKSQSIFEKLLV